MNKSSIRAQAREARRALSPEQQHSAAHRVCEQLVKQPVYSQAHHIAVYLANDGEISPHEIVAQAQTDNKRCYLPALCSDRLTFREFTADTELVVNRFGIPEPPNTAATVPPSALDLVLLPLVAFDRHGNRLGMGGGFYDRTFQFKRLQPQEPPALVGLAHAQQQHPALAADSWDIPLDAIATDIQWRAVTKP